MVCLLHTRGRCREGILEPQAQVSPPRRLSLLGRPYSHQSLPRRSGLAVGGRNRITRDKGIRLGVCGYRGASENASEGKIKAMTPYLIRYNQKISPSRPFRSGLRRIYLVPCRSGKVNPRWVISGFAPGGRCMSHEDPLYRRVPLESYRLSSALFEVLPQTCCGIRSIFLLLSTDYSLSLPCQLQLVKSQHSKRSTRCSKKPLPSCS